MTDYGTDISTFPVLDMTGRTITGPRVVAEAILRRYTTPAGFLEYDPEYGFDVRYLLNADLDDGELAFIEEALAREAEKDDRVASAFTSVTLDHRSSTLRIRVGGILANGRNFEFVLEIGSVSAAIVGVS